MCRWRMVHHISTVDFRIVTAKGKSESFTGTFSLIIKIMNPYSPTSRMSVSIALRQFGYITTVFLSNFRTALVRSWPTWSLRITYSNLMLDCKISTVAFVEIGIWNHLSPVHLKATYWVVWNHDRYSEGFECCFLTPKADCGICQARSVFNLNWVVVVDAGVNVLHHMEKSAPGNGSHDSGLKNLIRTGSNVKNGSKIPLRT